MKNSHRAGLVLTELRQALAVSIIAGNPRGQHQHGLNDGARMPRSAELIFGYVSEGAPMKPHFFFSHIEFELIPEIDTGRKTFVPVYGL